MTSIELPTTAILMLEITGADIAALGDADLRELIGLLCEAEVRRHGLSAAAVTWGGSQTAKDGGLDVRVDLPVGSSGLGFIPHAITGFQVKKPDMPRGEILKEMRPPSREQPEGVLRPAIGELADASGAYVIVSSAGSTSHSALTDRRKAMRDAVGAHASGSRLHTDFYDRNRVATWVREYAGLIPWVRSRIGRALRGWEPFGAWSRPPAGASREYLVDDTARVRTGKADDQAGVDIIEGINRMRDVLRQPGHAVRLVGLSGVGKTRLAEALFDAEVGVNPLDPSSAIYTNIAQMPDPPPPVLVSDLTASKARAIMVVDNCSAALHSQLAALALEAGSTVSVLTIEYDIREDQPEGTDVFVVGAASAALTDTLIAARCPHLSQVDRNTIAEFSGGNARLALAISGTIRQGETIAGLSDEELFVRLFHQRHEPDQALLRIAQACALVYSFEGIRLDGGDAELLILGGLVGKSAAEVYEVVAELKRRELVQARGVWRAVLPHAIANRLAARALQNIPPQTVRQALVDAALPRLRRSFSRRLGYLDGSPEARAIVTGWLGAGGPLENIPELDEVGLAMLVNVAPVAPDAVLAKLEQNASDRDTAIRLQSTEIFRLLRSLAYQASDFERATRILVKLAMLAGEGDSEAAKVFTSLFTIYVSGTHAPVEVRLKVVAGLLDDPEPGKRALGVGALRAMLEAETFHSEYDFDFGARSRDYGYVPQCQSDVTNWFGKTLSVAERYARGGGTTAVDVRQIVAEQFRGLWTSAAVFDDLERFGVALSADGFWMDGWRAVRHTRVYAASDLTPEAKSRLSKLEQVLRPKNLPDQIRGVVFRVHGRAPDLDDVEDDDDVQAAAARSLAVIRELGAALALDQAALDTLLPELLTGRGKLWEIGEALGASSEQPLEMWAKLVTHAAAVEQPAIPFLGGFLHALHRRDAEKAEKLLDAALTDACLSRHFPRLQTAIALNDAAVTRLYKSLRIGAAPIEEYNYLAYGRVSDGIPGAAFKRLVLAVARKPNGFAVALEILSMRLHGDHDPAIEIVETGQALLALFKPAGKEKGPVHARQTHELESVVKACLKEPASKNIAFDLTVVIRDAAAQRTIYAMDYPGVLKRLLAAHPMPVLDALFPADEEDRNEGIAMFNDARRSSEHPLNSVPEATLLEWCEADAVVRYPTIAKVAKLIAPSPEGADLAFTPLAKALLARAPNPADVLKVMVSRLRFPLSWSGSLASLLASRLKLLDTLDLGAATDLAAILEEAKANLARWIERERQDEADDSMDLGERFE